MAGVLSAVDVEDLARDERCRLQVQHTVDDVGDGADPVWGCTPA
jgi:hypothetical protein